MECRETNSVNIGKVIDRGSSVGMAVEGLTLDFGQVEKIHRWKEMPSCDEFVGYKRSKHTMVSYKDDLYVFGGDNSKTMLNDLLRFDVKEKSWVRAFTNGTPPAPRYHHSAIEFQGSMFIFGGYTGDIHSNSNLTNKNDLHEYRFATGQWLEWKFEGIKLVPRAAHGAACYDSKLWIFAGYDGNARLNDMWTTSLLTDPKGVHAWQEVKQSGSIPPTCCNFALAVAHDKMFVFSGQSGAKITNDLFQFDFATKFWTRLSTDHIVRAVHPPPDKRYGHTMVSYDRHLYVFGGASGNSLPKGIHCFDLDSQKWVTKEVAEDSQIPSGRLFHACAVVHDGMYVFGGTIDYNVRSGDMHRFQFSNLPRCTLHEDFGRLLESRQFCDVDFIIGPGGDHVPAHKSIICARSEVLKGKIISSANDEQQQQQQQRQQQQQQTTNSTTTTTSTSTSPQQQQQLQQQPSSSSPSPSSSSLLPLSSLSSSSSSSSSPLLRVHLPELNPTSFKLVLSYIYTDEMRPSEHGEDPSSNSVILLMMDVYKHALKLQLIRLEHLCLHYLQNYINANNVLTALQNADDLGLGYIKDYCLHFIVKDPLFNSIVMSNEFESVSKSLIIEIIRLRQSHNRLNVDMTSKTFDAHHCNTLESDMKKFLSDDDPKLSDITLTLKDAKLRGHRSILAARSSYFEALLRSFAPPDGVIEISVEDLVPQSLASLMKYLYYGEISMPADHSLYLFSASPFYGFTNNRLQASCKYNLEMNVNQMNVVKILEAADRIQANEMKTRALEIIVSNFSKVVKQPEFKTLNQKLLLEILYSIADKNEEGRERGDTSA